MRGLHFTCSCGTLVHVEVTVETQTITRSLPKDTSLKVKLLAARRQTSVSGLLAQRLETLVRQEDAYTRARDLLRSLWQVHHP